MPSLASRLHQSAWSAWSRYRNRDAFDRVTSFCLFVGYPRSGHSLVGAQLNAHRHAVISHELQVTELVLAGLDRDTIYARILANAAWFHLRGDTSNYSYRVPNQWQGRFEALKVIGDKRGGSAARAIADHPGFLDRFRATVRVPLRLVHVVRNPYDNIAAIALWHHLSIDESIEYYFSHCDVTGHFDRYADPADVLTIHHEDLIRDPDPVLTRLCAFLDLEADPGYLADCNRVTLATPSWTRRRVTWSPAQVAAVARQAERHAFLRHYDFAVVEEQPRVRPEPSRPVSPVRTLWPRLVRRFLPSEPIPFARGATAADPESPPDARYWDEVVGQFRRAGALDAWHRYMHGVYGGLIADWLPPDGQRRLKTDLFEEAVGRTRPLADLGPGSIGLDVSLEVARQARAHLRGVQCSCLVADLRAIPLRSGSMPGILSGSSLDHFTRREDLSAGLSELGRVLAPGGTLILTLDNPHNPLIRLRNRLPFRTLEAWGLVPYYVGVTLDRHEASQALAAIGLRVVEVRVVAHAPRAPAIWVVRIAERLGWSTATVPRRLSGFDVLGQWPTRYLTGYYLAFRAVKDASPQARPANSRVSV